METTSVLTYREPLVKPSSRASFHHNDGVADKELTAEEMQKLLERNQIVNPTGQGAAAGMGPMVTGPLPPYDIQQK